MSRPPVTLYTRAGCSLCDRARRAIEEARRRVDFDYEEIDIDLDPELVRRYNDDVPVVAIGGEMAFQHKVDMAEFLKKLAARR